jgi:hypothetical protein
MSFSIFCISDQSGVNIIEVLSVAAALLRINAPKTVQDL